MSALPVEALFTEELYQIEGKTVVVISQPWEQVSADDRVLLQKILQAVRLSTDAVTIVHQPVLSIRSIGTRPWRLIYFGSEAAGPQYEPTRIDDVSVILSASLAQLQTDSAAKQKLWAGLKVLFTS